MSKNCLLVWEINTYIFGIRIVKSKMFCVVVKETYRRETHTKEEVGFSLIARKKLRVLTLHIYYPTRGFWDNPDNQAH